MINELIGVKDGIIQLCPLPRESVHGHVGHCRVANFCAATCAEDFPEITQGLLILFYKNAPRPPCQ